MECFETVMHRDEKVVLRARAGLDFGKRMWRVLASCWHRFAIRFVSFAYLSHMFDFTLAFYRIVLSLFLYCSGIIRGSC